MALSCVSYLPIFIQQATWVHIIYEFFSESKGRELEDSDRLFAGDEDAAITERAAKGPTAGSGDLENNGTMVNDANTRAY